MVQEISLGQTFIDISNLHRDLDLEQSFPICKGHSGLKLCAIKTSLVVDYKMNGSGEIVRQSPTDISNLHCDLDLVHCNPLLSQETPVYDHTPSPTFGYKWIACLEDRIETVMFSLHINSCCDLDLEESEPIFSARYSNS